MAPRPLPDGGNQHDANATMPPPPLGKSGQAVTDLLGGMLGQQGPIGVPAGTTPAGLMSQAAPLQASLPQGASAGITAKQQTRQMGLLLQNGHEWMPPATMFTLAAAGLPDDRMLAAAEAIRRAVTGPAGKAGSALKSGFQWVGYDPVLEKQPSAALALKRYVSQVIGPWPIEEDDLGQIQQGLQKQGFGSDLDVNSVWSPQWNAAYNQWKQHQINDQLSGNQGGSLTFGKALDALRSITPKRAGNAIIGFLRSIPADARSIVADVASAVGDAGGTIVHPTDYGAAQRFGQVLGGAVEGQTPEEFKATHGPLRMLGDLGNLLLLSDGMKLGTSLAKAAGEGILPSTAVRAIGAEAGSTAAEAAAKTSAKEMGIAAAQRGPGVIARTIGRPVDLGNARFFQNLPVLDRAGPWIAKLNDADGLYYRTRTLLAAPYRSAGVRVAGQALSDIGMYGAKVRGLANLEAAGGDPRLQQSVQQTHTLDAVDDAVHKLGFTVGGHHVQASLDDLMFFLHPAVGHAAEVVGSQVDDLVDAAHAALGQTGMAASIERATDTPVSKLVEQAGGDGNYLKFWSQKIREHAAAHYAENAMNRLALDDRPDLYSPEWIKQMRDFEHTAWTDPTVMGRAVKEMAASPTELTYRIAKEIENSRMDPKAWASGELTKMLDASKIVRDELVPREAELVGPGQQVGLARLDTHDALQAQGKITALQNQLNTARAGGSVDAVRQAQADISEYLFNEMGVDARRQAHLDPGEKLAMARQHASMLATPIQADDETMGKLADLGYKPVAGTDIGWMHRELTPLDALDGELTRRRRIAESLGLNPTRYPTASIAQVRYLSVRHEIQNLVDSGKITLPPLHTVDTLLASLRDPDIFAAVGGRNPLMRRLTGAVTELAEVPHGRQLDEYAAKIADERAAKGLDALSPRDLNALAGARAREEILGGLQLRDIPRKKAIAVLTRSLSDTIPPDTLDALAAKMGRDPDELRILNDAPMMSTEDAERVYHAIVKGSAAPGAYMLGLSHLEDLARASLGFAGNGGLAGGVTGAVLGGAVGGSLAAAKGDNPLTGAATGAAIGGTFGALNPNALANLPNRLIQVRNDLRFQLSPYFDVRRVAKTNAKLAAEGVTPALMPLRSMIEAGTYDQDRDVLRRVLGRGYTKAMEGADDAERYLHEQSIFGFYNGRNYEAYAAGRWSRAGLSDEQVGQKITKVFGYGTRYGEGRSALERSANFVFFPFSFDKTLYRNFGGYLLDHPGQLVVLDGALRAYKQFNDQHLNGNNPLAASWLEQHMPLLQEAERLNAFAHGISPGEPGGVNRPLLNLFLPQKWKSSAAAETTLKGFVPALSDLQRLITEAPEQARIVSTAVQNLTRRPEFENDFKPATLSKDAQLQEAFQMRQDWYTAFSDAITYNLHHDSTKAFFPNDTTVWGPHAGQPVTKAEIDQIVARHYPAYNPSFGADFAVKQKAKMQSWVDSLYGTDKYDTVKGFVALAAEASKALTSDRYTAAQAAQDAAYVREKAADLARSDADFFDHYNRFFANRFGPLTKVSASGR